MLQHVKTVMLRAVSAVEIRDVCVCVYVARVSGVCGPASKLWMITVIVTVTVAVAVGGVLFCVVGCRPASRGGCISCV